MFSLDPTSKLVMLTVLRHGPLSRVDVGRRLGLSSGSMTRITRPLVERQLLTEGPPTANELGRPRIPLQVVSSAAHVIGVNLVPGRAYTVLTGLDGAVLDQAESPCDTRNLSTAAHQIAAAVERVAGVESVAGVGVALPASVDQEGGLHATRMLGWHGGNLSRAVTRLTGLSCRAANDVDALTLAEHWFGAGKGLSDFVTVTYGRGVGVGAIVDDALLLGHQGAAALLGRLWLPDGRLFRDVLSMPAVEARLSAALGRPVTLREAVLAEGFTDAGLAVLEDAAWALGQLVRAAAIAYAPQRVLLTGEGGDLVTTRLDLVRRLLAADWDEDLELPELLVGDFSFFSWARGAAALAIRALFETPADPPLRHLSGIVRAAQ